MTATTSDCSPPCLPDSIQERARSDPGRIWAICPMQDDHQAGIAADQHQPIYRKVTYGEFSSAIDSVTRILTKSLGKESCFDTLAYLGPTDLRYSIVVVAAIKAGYKIFLPSPRNSTAGFQSLLTELKCRVLVTTDPEPPCVLDAVKGHVMIKLTLPSLEDLLKENYAQEEIFESSISYNLDDPIFVLHTSGSTGFPKPIVYTHEFVRRLVLAASLGTERSDQKNDPGHLYHAGSFYCMLPPFHAAGLAFTLLLPAYFGCVPTYPLPGNPPTITSLKNVIRSVNLDWALLSPSIVTELAQQDKALKEVAMKLDRVMYIGGSIPQWAGNVVSGQTRLYQLLGSSECGLFPLVLQSGPRSLEDWNCLQIHPSFGAEFQHRFGNTFELTIVKQQNLDHHQPVFSLFPTSQRYHTRDLFEVHPSKPELWVYYGHEDDIIVFLNGEKTNPVSFEQHVCSHPQVRSALVAGDQMKEAILLIELEERDAPALQDRAGFVSHLWPTIREANRLCPAHAKIVEDRIIFTDASKPFVRTDKGTVQRTATWELFTAEMNLLNQPASPPMQVSGTASIKDNIRERVKIIMNIDTLLDDADFFACGMDCQQVLQLTRKLQAIPELSDLQVVDIYSCPSISRIAALAPKSQGGMGGKQDGTGDISDTGRLEQIQHYLDCYETEVDRIALLPTPCHAIPCEGPHPGPVVALTGSTGSIGAQLLHLLLCDPSISHVYCLNRRPDSEVIQQSRNKERGLPSTFEASKVTFLHAALSQHQLGLSDVVYNTLRASVTLLIHNAWPVNFNQPLKSFQPSLSGTVNLARLVAHAYRHPCLLFLSSVAAVSNYSQVENAGQQVPEAVISLPLSAGPGGYGESKYIAERTLQYAADKLRLTVGIARVGQIAGSVQNRIWWNKKEWFPSLVISSQYLGALPITIGLSRSRGNILDWIPLDQVSQILIELAFSLGSDSNDGFSVFNVAHPRPTQWKDMLPSVHGALSAGLEKQIDLVPFPSWANRLEKSALVTSGVSSTLSAAELFLWNPAIKLLHFYKALLERELFVSLDLSRASESSLTLRGLESLKTEWMQSWAEGWFQVNE